MTRDVEGWSVDNSFITIPISKATLRGLGGGASWRALVRAFAWLISAVGLLCLLAFAGWLGMAALLCELVPLVAVNEERAALAQLVCPTMLPPGWSWVLAVAGLLVVPTGALTLARRMPRNRGRRSARATARTTPRAKPGSAGVPATSNVGSETRGTP
jgi:hypothetical protein